LLSGNFNIFGDQDLNYRSGVPHNSLMLIIASTGIPITIIYFCVVNYFSKKAENIKQAAFIIAFSFFTLFLHGLLHGYYFIMFILIFKLLFSNQEERVF
jgi:hypothetical protein